MAEAKHAKPALYKVELTYYDLTRAQLLRRFGCVDKKLAGAPIARALARLDLPGAYVGQFSDRIKCGVTRTQ